MPENKKPSLTLALIDPGDTGERDKAQSRRGARSIAECVLGPDMDEDGGVHPWETSSYYVTLAGPLSGTDSDALKKAAADADGALLVVPAAIGDFEQALSTRSGYAQVSLQALFDGGVRQLVVACDGMHYTGPPYSAFRFDEIRKEVESAVKKAGFALGSGVHVLPVDARGDNVFERSSNMPWYKGSTLDETVEMLKPR
ncbi:hypothetical protein [Streptomyces sp. NPDC021020]|uniref:hypothetical protein n=1 Tax=Streptomyces sp. NPDC021020 TaxID=3365109 RepID=UPI0037B61D94